MARAPQTLRYLIEGSSVTVPNVTDVGSSRYNYLMTLLSLFVELSLRHGSLRQTDAQGNTTWVAQFGEPELQAMRNWLAWHSQYEEVRTLDELFVLPVATL